MCKGKMLVNTAIASNSSMGFQPVFSFRGMSHVTEDVADKLALNRSLIILFFLLKTHVYELQNLEQKVSCTIVGRTQSLGGGGLSGAAACGGSSVP